MPATDQQAQVEELKTAEMLEEMIKSTHQLDEILQRLCAANSQSPNPGQSKENETLETTERVSEMDVGDEFEDCIGSATTEGVELTAEEYFQTIRRVFQTSVGGKLEISASPVNIGRLLGSLGGGGDLAVRFASCTRDTSFVFAPSSSGGSTVGASPPPEFSVSYSYVLSRLRRQITACDHIVPVERADAAAQLAFLLLEEQQRWLLSAISNHFPYQRESVYWTQGNRVCEVVVQEAEQKNQWGLLVQLNVTSQLRARVSKRTDASAAESPSDNRDPGLSSCTHCIVFLPKNQYLRSPDAEFQASIAVELLLYDPEEQSSGVSESSHSRANADRRSEGGSHVMPVATELSELLTVSQWGTHDESPTMDDKSNSHPEGKQNVGSWFKKIEIETQFPRNRIVQAACSRFHTLFLNDMGLVFASGHTLDGALGLGYEVSGYVAQPTLVDFFFDNLIVVQDIACGGDQLVGAHSAAHAAAISDSGDLYMWGEGRSSADVGGSNTNYLTLSSLPKLVNSGQRFEQGGFADQDIADIGTHSVEHVVCGGGQTIAFSSGSFLARSMTKLYREAIVQAKLGELDQATAITGADLVFVVSGQRLLVHKLLLAQRSPVLRELILDEEQQQRNRLDGAEGDVVNRAEPIELLLPRLRIDVARALVEFIYTDNFSLEVTKPSYYLVNDVLRAARLYRLPGLARLCRERLFSSSPSSLFGTSTDPPVLEEIEEDDERSDTNSEEDGDEEDVSSTNRTLNDDMRFALSDVIWADTVLVAEGRQIPVHRCMLVARSEYFRAVLAFRHSAAHLTDGIHAEKAVVNVEDSYAEIVRVLRFIYYDQVALPNNTTRTTDNNVGSDEDEVENHAEEEASDQLLEDLVAADKYGLERMKRLCEHAIYVTVANSLEVLAVAELVHAAHLKQVAMRFVQTHLADVTARREEFQRFQEDFPQLLEELYASLRDASRDEFLLREWHKEVGTSLAAQRQDQELEWSKTSKASFPWVPLSLAVAFGTMYLSMMHSQEHEYSAVPATNLVAIAAIGGAIVMGYL
ncbi:hypothetical protein PR003_g3048 [Phytophthora rubi]|uniref:BTB domain-containing protein n=1 Tax=Phytophthora rubi TaxID=129364 RepID=A0A6A4FWK5_9STRA|nr:hypothetical protein PR003_g3048 [Phytophthora rubi]